jgi:hypothetical protein
MLSVRFPEPSYVEFSPPFVSMSPLPEATYAIGTSFFMPPLHSTPPPAQFLAENIKPPSTDFYHHEDSTNDMDDSLNHSAYMDMYSTPGPGYRTVPPVYFDSPTEDPSDSDPLEPAYELDSLDFRWEPFIQKDPEKDPTLAPQTPPSALNPAVVSNSDDYYYEIQVEPEGEDDTDGQLYASINMGPKFAERSPSPGPFSFAPPADDLPTTHELDQSTPATPEAPFFAPVPGIFISPLRGNEALNTPPKGGESTQVSYFPFHRLQRPDSL